MLARASGGPAIVMAPTSVIGNWQRELERFAPSTNSGQRYLDFLKFSERLNDISQRFFFYKPIGGLRDMFDFKTAFDPKVLGDVLAMRMGRSVAGTVRSFTPDARVALAGRLRGLRPDRPVTGHLVSRGDTLLPGLSVTPRLQLTIGQ